MVPPTMFVSGAIAVLHVCSEVYTRFRGVKRFREDCQKLAHFVHRIEAFITETEDDTDMTGPGWEAAFSALHGSLLEVVGVFEDCARYGMIRSMMNADELNLRLNAISQRLTLSLQLIPIQKTKAMDKRLTELQAIQAEIRAATFTAVRAAEEQSASLKRLMDQSRVDADKTHEMLEQLLLLLQSDRAAQGASACKAAAGPGPLSEGGTCTPLPSQQQQQVADGAQQPVPAVVVDIAQLEAELADLHVELKCAVQNKHVSEEQYLKQIIAAISAVEAQQRCGGAGGSKRAEAPVDLRCPITRQLMSDPVILIDSAQTYERGAIKEWLDRGNRKDPVTGVMLSSLVLVPNIAVRKMAQDWRHTNGLPASTFHECHSITAPPRTNPQQQQQQKEQKEPPDAAAADSAAAEAAAAAAAAAPNSPSAASAGVAAADAAVFSLNPKTAAILAAGASVGLSSPFHAAADNAAFLHSSNNDKQLAQQAYTRAVAAAAAGAAATTSNSVVAMAVGAVGSGTSSSVDQWRFSSMSASSSGGGSDASRSCSMALARDGSTRSLPSFLQQQQQQCGLDRAASDASRLTPIDDETEECLDQWPSAAAAAAAAGWAACGAAQQQSSLQQQQQQQQQQSSLQQQQQSSLQPVASQASSHAPFGHQTGLPQRSWSPLGSSRGSSFSMGGGSASRQERAVAAAAVAATLVAQQQQQGGSFRLLDLHGTLGRAAETRYKMSRKHSSPAAAEAVLSMQQQIQQQQQEVQAAEERQYLQQHVERLLRSHSHERGAGQRHSIASTCSAPRHQQQQQQQQQQHVAGRADGNAPSGSAPSGGRFGAGGAAARPFSSSGAAHLASRRPSVDSLASAPAVLHDSQRDAAARGSLLSSPAEAPTALASALACPSLDGRPLSAAAAAASSQGSGLSVLGFGRRKQQQQQCYHADIDRASISSLGSASSRRSVGKHLLATLKSIKYSVIYDDDKV